MISQLKLLALLIYNFLDNRKILLRSIALILFATHVTVFVILPLSGHSSPPENSEMSITNLLTFMAGASYGIIFYVFWGYTFYNCRTAEFRGRASRIIWSLVVLFGGFASVGPLAYYITVVEMGKGLKDRTARQPSA